MSTSTAKSSQRRRWPQCWAPKRAARSDEPLWLIRDKCLINRAIFRIAVGTLGTVTADGRFYDIRQGCPQAHPRPSGRTPGGRGRVHPWFNRVWKPVWVNRVRRRKFRRGGSKRMPERKRGGQPGNQNAIKHGCRAAQRTVLRLRLPSGPASPFLPRNDASDRFQLGILCPRASIFAMFFLLARILRALVPSRCCRQVNLFKINHGHNSEFAHDSSILSGWMLNSVWRV